MSSDLKDARWGLAHHYARAESGFFDRLLDLAGAWLDRNPEDVLYWAKKFRRGDD